MKAKNIQALIFDLDGTAIPLSQEGRPSPTVIQAVRQVKDHVKVSVATGRAWQDCRVIIQQFQIEEPIIIAGGTQLYHPIEDRLIWEKHIKKDSVAQIFEYLAKYPYEVYGVDGVQGGQLTEKDTVTKENVIFVIAVTKKDTKSMLEWLKRFEHLESHAVPSWTSGHFDVHVTHQNANKKQAMNQLLDHWQLKPDSIMVVGDSSNDLPLFERAGFKIAMGNASGKLKEAADHITASVENDGLAQAINKYIIHSTQ